ncbi:uncharacterized protein LOC120267277 [Dioscorea cayenensis subsp. rotundata]|uniref:Uncharacterized protein LOC120267277 n=1 Tax=Dioscorea cayennensis subsp. rotundata TaxID=55577 RepID=A0AB40BTV7_DIOCR|nr:uncharacterized protein LOC120267277 [Dioscorea cayenensis subsp. rotundata]
MANQGSSSGSSSQVIVPHFSGEGYSLWSLKMETVLISRDLWKLVEKGYDEDEADEHKLNENIKKNAKALCLIQQRLDDKTLIRISQTRNAKKAWDILKKEYQGCTKSSAAKLYAYRQQFETIRMKNGDTIQDYVSKVLTLAHHIRTLGEDLPDQSVVGKILRSLTPKFRHVVSSIIEAKDLTTLTVDELSGSLKGHEGRLDMENDQVEVKAFHIKGEASSSSYNVNTRRGRGRGGFRGRSRGRGRGHVSEQKDT